MNMCMAKDLEGGVSMANVAQYDTYLPQRAKGYANLLFKLIILWHVADGILKESFHFIQMFSGFRSIFWLIFLFISHHLL
jgi:hypothetical protein